MFSRDPPTGVGPARYSIADDKVQGKLFKTQCKKCSNVITFASTQKGGSFRVPFTF